MNLLSIFMIMLVFHVMIQVFICVIILAHLCTSLSLSPPLSLSLPFPFPGAEPTEPEKEVYSRISEILSDAPRILEELRAYKGAGESIREVRKLWGEGEWPMYKLYSPDSFKLHPVM